MKYLFTLLMMCLCLCMVQAQVIDQDEPNKARRQVISMDLIVQGSECLGIDCPSAPSFGFNTLELKENNLRIRFTDTSTSASFPTTDWEITINESANGGKSAYMIQDITNGKIPFQIEANARTNALYVEDDGDIGIGTSTPAVDVDIKTGNTPTVRLQQDGTSGFTPQTWDLAGNEANFFIRDVTNGSQLPFRIKPGADSDALFIDSDNDIGMGTASPAAPIHVVRTAATVPWLKVDAPGNVRADLTSTDNLGVQFRFISNSANNRRLIAQGSDLVTDSQIALLDDGTIDFYGQMTSTFSKITPGNTMLTASSSRSLKNSIKKFEVPDILDRIAQVPVTTYKWKREMAGEELAKLDNLGLIAQDFYTVFSRGKDTEINGQDVQMALWLASQKLYENDQELEDKIREKDTQISELQDRVSDLTARLDEISDLLESNQQNVLLNAGERAILGQNYPNPYLNETVIEYFVPESSQDAEVQFTDIAGKLIKKVSIQNGKGKINLKVQDLPQGNYTYSLIVDGKIVNTKQMSLAR